MEIFTHPGDAGIGDPLVTNPAVAAVHRWIGEEHSTIQVEGVFEQVAGKQAVLLKKPAS